MRNLYFAALILLASLNVSADQQDFNRKTDRIGCGVITSIRKVNQKPKADSRFDHVSTASGFEVGSILRLFGFGMFSSIVGDAVSTTGIDALRKNADDARKTNEEETNNYKDVVAVKFTFDDGRVVNIPMPDWSGMRYSPNVRLRAYYAQQHNTVQLPHNALFDTVSSPSDTDYLGDCGSQIDPEIADSAIENSANLVDESKIFN